MTDVEEMSSRKRENSEKLCGNSNLMSIFLTKGEVNKNEIIEISVDTRETVVKDLTFAATAP